EYGASLPGRSSLVPFRLCTCEHTVDVTEFPGLEPRQTWGTLRILPKVLGRATRRIKARLEEIRKMKKAASD
ncbi:MAG: hypothetical protein ABSD98_05655, partial [Candidatus Korobacteraceae bacterium]